MAVSPAGLINQGQLDAEIKSAVSKLGPEAVQVFYNWAEDWTGEPSIFFRIVLTDNAAREENLMDVTGRITTFLFDELRTIERWGLHPYFNFSSQSELKRYKDPDWS